MNKNKKTCLRCSKSAMFGNEKGEPYLRHLKNLQHLSKNIDDYPIKKLDDSCEDFKS